MPESTSSTFERGLQIIEAFGPANPRMSLADLSNATGLDRAVVRRLVNTLVKKGYATKDGRLFELTPRILAPGHAFMASNGWGLHLTAQLDELSRALNETVSLSIWSGSHAVTLARSNAAGRHMALIAPQGGLPIHASAAARVLMSGLPTDEITAILGTIKMASLTPHTLTGADAILHSIEQVQRDGHIIAREELELGLIAVSVPVHGAKGRVVAALNVSTQCSRMSEEQVSARVLPQMKRTAQMLSPQIS